MENPNVAAAAAEFLASFDPGGVGFWKTVLPPPDAPRPSVEFQNPRITATGQAPGSSGLYKRSFEAIGLQSEPFKRIYDATYELQFRLHQNTTPKPLHADSEKHALAAASNALINSVRTLRSFSGPILIVNPPDYGLTFKPFPFGIEFQFTFDQPALPIFIPLPPRKPRKWGRSLTPRWEAEHEKLVQHRKFAANKKRMKLDPNLGKFGRKGTGVYVDRQKQMSTLAQRAKVIAMEKAIAAVQAHYKRNKRAVTRGDARKVVGLLKARLASVKKKANAWQPMMRTKRKK